VFRSAALGGLENEEIQPRILLRGGLKLSVFTCTMRYVHPYVRRAGCSVGLSFLQHFGVHSARRRMAMVGILRTNGRSASSPGSRGVGGQRVEATFCTGRHAAAAGWISARITGGWCTFPAQWSPQQSLATALGPPPCIERSLRPTHSLLSRRCSQLKQCLSAATRAQVPSHSRDEPPQQLPQKTP
jgi:hypothetical protein